MGEVRTDGGTPRQDPSSCSIGNFDYFSFIDNKSALCYKLLFRNIKRTRGQNKLNVL